MNVLTLMLVLKSNVSVILDALILPFLLTIITNVPTIHVTRMLILMIPLLLTPQLNVMIMTHVPLIFVCLVADVSMFLM